MSYVKVDRKINKNVDKNVNSADAFKKLASELEDPDQTYQNFVKTLSKYHFEVKAIIQVSKYLNLHLFCLVV